MDEKRYKKHIFFTTGILTLVVFFSGMMLGWGLDKYRTQSVLDDLRDNELNAESYLTEQQFFSTVPNLTCGLAATRVTALSEELGMVGRDLAGFSGKSMFEQSNYDYLTRKYFLMEVKTYSLFEDFMRNCPSSNFTRILYFYRIDDRASINQGYAIDELVRNNKNVKVFSFDIDYDKDPLLKTVKAYYNITQAPTMIINGAKRQEGFTDVSTLDALINGK